MKISMIFLWLSFTAFTNIQGQEQLVSMDWLQSQSSTTERNILIVFSGSDWCKPCIQLDKEILQSADFLSFQEDHLVLYKADFPYQKKNQVSRNQQLMNEKLAEAFNPKGAFPNAVLLNSDLELINSIPYRSGMQPEEFINQIKEVL